MYHCLVSWKITPLYFFSSNLTYFWQKEAIKVKFSETYDWLGVNLPNSLCHIWNLHFHRFFLLKVYKTSTKKLQQVYVSWHCKMMQNLKRNWLFFLKVKWEILQILTQALKCLKICTLMGSFWPRYMTFQLKKIQRIYFSWHWRVIKNLKKNWLLVWKITWRIWQIFNRALGSLKIETLTGSFHLK